MLKLLVANLVCKKLITYLGGEYMGKILKNKKIKRVISLVLMLVVLGTSMRLESFLQVIWAKTNYTKIYLKDNTAEQWLGNDNAVMELVDNTSGHIHYIMTKEDSNVWSVQVPDTTYNVTFNRLSPDCNTQWNSWSAGGRDDNNVYFADGGEYGHWELIESSNEEEYFHAGDVVYLDLTHFVAWKDSNASLYINFTDSSKKENNGQDINLSKSDKSQYNPKKVDMKVKENIYAYVIGFEDEGSTELRFWRGNSSTLWNYSVVLSYDDYVKGINCVRISNWDDNGYLIETEYKIDMDIDSDGDGLSDYYEEIYGLNRYDVDTDADGLTDFQEIYIVRSNPLAYDSLVKGVSDFEVDNDNDGLKNGIEIELGTNPNIADSDGDGLSDGDEINIYFTNPNNSDTDGDTLNDGDEIKLKFSPLLKDTDDNGILDCDEKIFQNLEIDISNEDRKDISKVSVEFKGTGYINSTTDIEDLYGKDKYISDTVGLVGVPIDINSSSKFDNAKITFFMNESYSAEMLKKLIILWYDEKNNRFVEQETHYDEINMSVSTEVNHFSKYMVVDKEEWFEAWNKEIKYPNSNNIVFDTVILIDCSGSMRTNDPDFEYSVKNTLYPGSSYQITTCYRKLASKNYVKAQGNDDRTGIVLFTSEANTVCELTNSECVLMNAIDKIYSNGGTNFNNAIKESIRILTNTRNDSEKRILLVSDGESELSSSVIDLAIENNIKINTVYIGGQNNNELLKNVAERTGGKYFKAVTADELINIYSEIMIDQKIDSADSDKDGIPDVFEISGMRLSNGTIIYTDPFNPDTDGDGLLDGEEIDVIPTFWINTIFNKFDVSSEVAAYIFDMKSNPNMKDTDGDGISDKDDPLKLIFGYNKRLTEENKSELYEEIETQINKDFNWIMQHKNIGYYSTMDCIDIIYENDEFITEICNKYLLPKAAVQSILLRELRCYDVMDDIADSLVAQQFAYLYLVELYNNSSWYQQLIMGYPDMPVPYREDSSVGYGQILTETAIKTLNWYYKSDNYDYTDWHDREYIWYRLKDENEFNIEMVALVLMWGAKEEKLTNDYWNYSYNDIIKMLSRYNGRGSGASRYGKETYNCYCIFNKYNTRS